MSSLIHHLQPSMLSNTETSNQQKRLPNNPPKNLSQNEILSLYDILGKNSVTLATAVAQILYGNNGVWKKQACGVLCYIKDYDKRDYYFRLYDLRSKQIIFEEIAPGSLRLEKSLDRLYTFDGMNCKIGINFVDPDEAQTFCHYFHKKQEDRQSKRKTGGTTISRIVYEMKPPSNETIQTPISVSTPKKQSASKSSIFSTLGRGKKKHVKLDISSPDCSTFVRKNHIGLHDSFFTDESQKQLFEKVLGEMHVSKDEELYIRDTIANSNNTLQELSTKSKVPTQQSHNPSVVRQDNGCRAPYQDISIPPLTYNRTLGQNQFIPPPVSNQESVSPIPLKTAPRLPPPLPPNLQNQNQNSSIPPAPPMPPPLPSNFQNQNYNSSVPPPPPPVPIVSPKPITNEPPTTTSNTAPSSFLDDIRRGKALNPVSERPVISKPPLNDDSKPDPQRSMEEYIRAMLEKRRADVMGREEDESEPSDDEWCD